MAKLVNAPCAPCGKHTLFVKRVCTECGGSLPLLHPVRPRLNLAQRIRRSKVSTLVNRARTQENRSKQGIYTQHPSVGGNFGRGREKTRV